MLPISKGDTRLASIAILLSIWFAGLARAGSWEIDLSSYVNADLTTYSGGFNYPQHGGALTVDTIPFQLATIGPKLDTAIVQVTANQPFSLSIGVFGVRSAYVLVNSAYGACGTDIGEIDFIGSWHTFAYILTEGSNVRDHFNGSFCNAAPDIAGSANFGTSDRLDMQLIALPAEFSKDTLQSMEFKGFGQGERGLPFLAAATIVASGLPDPASAVIPEPSSFWFMCIGGIIMLWIRRFGSDDAP